MTLLLSDAEVRRLLPMNECIEVMQAALMRMAHGSSTLPLRAVVRLPDTNNAFASMPAIDGSGSDSSIGAKVITVFPGNEATPYDSHQGVVLLFESVNGRLLAVADASSITAIRTAAVSGLATRVLAREDASELTLLGAGVLALPHLAAICAVRPIRKVRVWSRSYSRVQALVKQALADQQWMNGRSVELIACECSGDDSLDTARDTGRDGASESASKSARDAVANADVVCTITSARVPILHGSWLRSGTHVNAVGASLAHTRELDSEAVRIARMFVDRKESTMAESGDFLIPRSQGVIDEDHILGELGEVITGAVEGRKSPGDITLFKSLGLAVEDVAALRHIYRRAFAEGGGKEVSFGGLR